MAKAVLVIDLPSLDKKQINYLSVSFGGIPYNIGRDEMILRPLPQKKEETFTYWMARGCNDPESYINGWNDCLDEITGETE